MLSVDIYLINDQVDTLIIAGWGNVGYFPWTAETLGRLGEARELCEQSLAIRQELGDQHGMAEAMRFLARAVDVLAQRLPDQPSHQQASRHAA